MKEVHFILYAFNQVAGTQKVFWVIMIHLVTKSYIVILFSAYWDSLGIHHNTWDASCKHSNFKNQILCSDNDEYYNIMNWRVSDPYIYIVLALKIYIQIKGHLLIIMFIYISSHTYIYTGILLLLWLMSYNENIQTKVVSR